jgi:hypothetical protein
MGLYVAMWTNDVCSSFDLQTLGKRYEITDYFSFFIEHYKLSEIYKCNVHSDWIHGAT